MSICWAPNSISPRSRAASCVYRRARRLKNESTVVGRQLWWVKLWEFLVWRRKKNKQNKGNLTFQVKTNETCSLGSITVCCNLNPQKTCLETPGKRIQWTPWPECCAVVPSPTPAFPAADAEMSKMVGMQRTGNKTLRKPRKWLLAIFSLIFHSRFFGKHGRMVAHYFGVKLMDGTHDLFFESIQADQFSRWIWSCWKWQNIHLDVFELMIG